MAASCALFVLTALVQIATSPPAPVAESEPAAPDKGEELAALERMLLGSWKGCACCGDYTFNPDGTFGVQNFTPGNNTLTGTWSIRWDALPPTLVVLAKTSDFTADDSDRDEYEYLNKPLELKLLELNSDSFVYSYPNSEFKLHNDRPVEREE